MCGIFLCLDRQHAPPPSAVLKHRLKCRGPDSLQEFCFNLDGAEYDGQLDQYYTSVSCVSSVLSLRGDCIVKQPVINTYADLNPRESSFLCWNGEAWTFSGTILRGNDSSHVFNTLCHVSEQCLRTSVDEPDVAISEALAAYAGPFAFAFYDHNYHRLYCGRDFLGRRSLLYKYTPKGTLLISSVPDSKEEWMEFEADGIYWVDLEPSESKAPFELKKSPYTFRKEDQDPSRYVTPSELTLRLSAIEKESAPSEILDRNSQSVRTIHRLLAQALKVRCLSIPNRVVPTQRDLPPSARIAILFSGGIDCSLLARLSHDILQPHEPIDLINVAFENPRVHSAASAAGKSPFEQCPDRKTAESSLAQLRASCPGRVWRLIRANVPFTEFSQHRETIIELIYPHNTEMDLSIAAALYFAARGRGTLDDGSSYETTARVLFSGLGADELFGGYTRHGTAFNRGGLAALQDELALDISRLGKRNLGRDDRVISHWAKEARYPFLDETVVAWALSVPLRAKCGFDQPPIADEGGGPLDPAKMLLRCLALNMGLGSVANEKKRAVSTYCTH